MNKFNLEEIMLKIRITYDQEKTTELEDFIKKLNDHYRILNQSAPYKGRGNSVYANIYLDIEKES